MIALLFKMMVVHALADFSLQGDAMAKGKNRNRKPDYVPEGQKVMPCWPYWLSAHALICGGGIYLVTGNIYLGMLETCLHWMIDFAKCENWTNPNHDQALHFVCRLGYLFMV